MSDFGIYSGKQFLEMELPKREFLVEGLIRVKDSVLFVGNEKSGKSLFIFQLICSLTTQHPFIDKYSIGKVCKVSYIQLEGELGDSQDRFKRMIKTLDFAPEHFQYMFLPPLELQERSHIMKIRDKIQEFHKPDVVIIDPIYFAFMGSLNDDAVVRKFIGNIRILKDSLQCAVILVHHTHKIKWTSDGKVISEGDEALFGSKFLPAWADHLLFFIYDRNRELRILSCNTQRSGDIMKECNLRLIEPDPLYFEATEKELGKDGTILELLDKEEYVEGLTAEQIFKKLDISRRSFYYSIKKPLAQDKLIKVETVRPIKYRLRK